MAQGAPHTLPAGEKGKGNVAAASPPVVDAPLSQFRHSRVVRGTVLDLMMLATSPSAANAAAAAAFDEVEQAVALLGAGPANGFTALNNSADAVILPPDVFAVLREAHRLATLSKGAFDPTAASYTSLYQQVWPTTPSTDEASTAPIVLPTDDALAARSADVGVNRLRLDVAARSARRTGTDTVVGLGGAEIGYAMDRAKGVLVEHGITSFVLSADGDVVVYGLRGDRPWMVGVQDPRGSGPFLVFPVDVADLGGAVMTASDNEGVRYVDEVRLHRLLDPASGKPGTKSRSVTVIHDDAFIAECLARAAFIMGPRDGLRMLARQKGANGIFVDEKNQVHLTPGLKKLAKSGGLTWRPPTDEQ